MKKILYSFLALVIVFPVAASAATFSFTPSVGTFAPGETFNVTVFVNPSSGEKITTAKLSATFPADIVEVVSFTQESGWMALTQPGYDLTDNTAGKLIKTGGFPAKVTSSKQFGVITLKAKSAGTAVVGVEGDSMMLDTANADKYKSSDGASFLVVAPAPVPVPEPEVVTTPTPAPEPTATPVVASAPEEEAPEVAVATTTSTTTDTDTTSTPNTQLAAAAGADTGSENGMSWYYILAGIALLLVLVVVWRRWGNKTDKY